MDSVSDNLKATRLELMKVRGIDPKKMQEDIDDMTKKITNLKSPVMKKVSMGTKVKNYDQKQLKDALKVILPNSDDGELDAILKKYADSTIKGLVGGSTYFSSTKTAFKKKLESLAAVPSGDPSEIKRLEKLLNDKADELAKIKKRYGLELDDKFSKERKDKAYWFTGADAKPRADKVLRPNTGAVWQAARAEERKACIRVYSWERFF